MYNCIVSVLVRGYVFFEETARGYVFFEILVVPEGAGGRLYQLGTSYIK
jgi:hypothetical protein